MLENILIYCICLPLLYLVPFELATKLIHQYIMHGFGWAWHASHHQSPGAARFEKNDLYAIVFAAIAICLFYLAREVYQSWWMASFAIGLTLYGFMYFLVHDFLIHRRVPNQWFRKVKSPYIRRLMRAHALHHKVQTKENCEAFGFLYASPKYAFPKFKPVAAQTK